MRVRRSRRRDCLRVRFRGRRARVGRQEERAEREPDRDVLRAGGHRRDQRRGGEGPEDGCAGAVGQGSRQPATRPATVATRRGGPAGTSCSTRSRRTLTGLADRAEDPRRARLPRGLRHLAGGGAKRHSPASPPRSKVSLAGIDSKRRAAQVKALRIYGPTLGEISKSFAEPFRPVTQVCYSPKDLASIQASPRSSPSPARARAPELQTVTYPRRRGGRRPDRCTSAPSSVALHEVRGRALEDRAVAQHRVLAAGHAEVARRRRPGERLRHRGRSTGVGDPVSVPCTTSTCRPARSTRSSVRTHGFSATTLETSGWSPASSAARPPSE